MPDKLTKDLISIILPVYNGEAFLADAIESVLNQNYQNFELLIVDDCSTDSSLKISENFAHKDNRIKIYSNKSNLKLPASLNIGHKLAIGNFITWTSHDNLLKINFIEEHLRNIKDSNSAISYSNYDIIYEDGLFKRENSPGPPEFLLFGNQIGASFLYKKEVFLFLNDYDENIFLVEDYDFWLRASLSFKFSKLERNLFSYRIHNNSLTSKISMNTAWKDDHSNAILQMFMKLKETCSWKNVTSDFLISIHHNSEKALVLYLKNKKVINTDFKKYCNKYMDYSVLRHKTNKSLRQNYYENSNLNNIYNLLMIVLIEKGIIFNKDYSIKMTFKLILKSIF